MAKSYTITETEVRSLATVQSFDRGYIYYRNGSVHNLIRRGNQITARVEGSDYEPYKVEALLEEHGITESSCTCPYDWGGICKHIVATLLVVVFEADTIVEKPPITDVLENLTAEQLRQVLNGLAEMGIEFAKAIEREVSWLQNEPAKTESDSGATSPVDFKSVRREISKDFRLTGKSSSFQYGYYDEYNDIDMYPEEILQPHLEKVLALLDADDKATLPKRVLGKRMIEATRKTHPDWGIRKSKHQAEYIMDTGRAGNYDTAVSWLRLTRDIYLEHQRQVEWERYLESLLDTHQRKYKLVPMLRNIRA